MLVLGVPVELPRGWFQNMGGRQAAGRNPPAVVLPKQGGFGLRAGQTELAGIARQPPSGVILAQYLETLGDLGLVKPFDFVFLSAWHGIEAFRDHELHGARAVLADMGDETKNVAGRYLEFRGPTREDLLV